jgi:hypothetical protein
MFLYGKHYFTRHGFNLDEVKSLFQKALRRKKPDLVCAAAKELGHILSWQKILTYIFEDHGLISSEHLRQVLGSYMQSKLEKTEKQFDVHKETVIDLLLSKCKTSRIAACLPVISMDKEYDIETIEEETEIFVSPQVNCLNMNRIIASLRKAWKKRDSKRIISMMKLVTASHDLEKRTLTKEGKDIIPGDRLGVGQLVLALLCKDTCESENELSSFLHTCLRISLMIPNTPMRLMLFSVVAHLLFSHQIPTAATDLVDLLDWKSVGLLKQMPMWATDKHTYRGKYGKSTVREAVKMGYSHMLEEFHGARPKCDLAHFFDEGVKEACPLFPNPYWEKTKAIYFSFTPDKQKTVLMTKAYVSRLQTEMPDLFCRSRKRKWEGEEGTDKKKRTSELPLLQIPCGPHKYHTRVDLEKNIVKKGPMETWKINGITAVYTLMRVVFKDKHTLPLTKSDNYLIFPLLKGENATLHTEERMMKDYKSGTQIKTDFIDRKSLGLCQLHKLSEQEVCSLPPSLWNHFLLRFILKVGDSGLFNALTDEKRTFIYGIDLDERRDPSLPTCILDVLFTKRPRKVLCDVIITEIKLHKLELINNMKRIDTESATIGELLTYIPYIYKNEIKMRKAHVLNILSKS